MIKKILNVTVVACLCQSTVFAQSALDMYFQGTNTFKVIGDASKGLVNPQDLDFVPGKPNEWWVLNYEANSGSVVIFYNAGEANQSSEFRRDSHADHFMVRPSAIAFGDNGNFTTTHEVQNTNPGTPTFMGPALWTSDTSIFARMHQSNWDPSKPLGSHIDMLHQSPFSMGVAHDHDNAYWVFDGYSGHICKYDFKTPHDIGADDHADGEIFRYSSLNVTREVGIPSHLAMDKKNKWLYIVDGGTGRILRLKTDSGTPGASLMADAGAGEPIAVYKEMNGFTTEVVVASGLSKPCGIDYSDGRIIVSDNATGEIFVYNVTTMPATLIGKINTGSVGVMGVRVDKSNRIWYVNRMKREVVRIDNPNVPTTIQEVYNETTFRIYPNPANDIVFVEFENTPAQDQNSVRLYDMTGKLVHSVIATGKLVKFNTGGLAKGVYTIEVSNIQERIVKKLIIQ